MNSKVDVNKPIDAEFGKFRTMSGVIIDIMEPTQQMINIVDIANALSKIPRWGGHTPEFFSVAQHSILVETLCEEDNLKKVALMHDATEAYLGDVIKPLKMVLGNSYEQIEDRFGRLIFERFGLDYSLMPEIKKYDKFALNLEFESLHKNGDYIDTILRKPGKTLNYYLYAEKPLCWGHNSARALFLHRFKQLFETKYHDTRI